MTAVCVIVVNSLVREPRATKQIATLLRAGYRVSVFGVRDRPGVPARFLHGDGAQVALCASRRWAVALTACLLCLPAAAGLLLAGLPDGLASRTAALLLAAPAAAGIALAGSLVAREAMASDNDTQRSAWRRLRCALLDLAIARAAIGWATRRLVWPLQETISRIWVVRQAAPLQPDIVHCHDIYTLPIGAALAERTGAALIYDAHEIYEAKARRTARDARRYRAILERYAGRLDGFVTTNPAQAAYYGKACLRLPLAVPISNSTAPRPPGEVYDGRLHRAAGLPAERKILLYHGYLSAGRGLETLVRAAPHLPPGWTLVIMGPGHLRDRLAALARSAMTESGKEGAAAGVHFLPPVAMAELPHWVRGAALGIIPHEPDCLNHRLCSPNKLWECASVGVPILAADLETVRACVESHGMGWILPRGAGPREIAAAVAAPGDADFAAARAGCLRFMAAESWSHSEARLLALYESLRPQGRRVAAQPHAIGLRARAAAR